MNFFPIAHHQLAHLSQRDPVLGQLISHVPVMRREIESSSFIALVSSIVYQQISTAAGNAIWARFTQRSGVLTPARVLAIPTDDLRSCGLSGSKAAYIHAIAEAFNEGRITDDFLKKSSNEVIVKRLTEIKGIGTWTAEMYLMFGLGRTDVFSYKDLGLRNGIQWLYGLSAPPTEAFVSQLVRLWQPYATIAAFYLWEATIQGLSKASRQALLGDLPYDVQRHGIGTMNSPIGPLSIIADQNALHSISFTDAVEDFNETPLVRLAKEELTEYFEGRRKAFTLPLAKTGTPFQQQVYAGLCTIPFGETLSYGELAKKIGNEKASRAVGNANNKNPLPIVVPCHRVVGANGQLVGYAGGLDKKEWLLGHERQ